MISSLKNRYFCSIVSCFCVILLYVVASRKGHEVSTSAPSSESLSKAALASPAITKLLKNRIQLKSMPGVPCKIYSELRGVDFRDPRLSSILCQGVVAYRLQHDGTYPLCQLAHPFNEFVLEVVGSNSKLGSVPGASGKKYSIFVYPFEDWISAAIMKRGHWESQTVARLMKIATLLPNTTFLDIGSNICVYTLAAAQLNLPTVSLEANLRNVLRLRLSLRANGFDVARSRIVWNFVSPDVDKLQFLRMPSDCNMGGGSGIKCMRPLQDTVHVMPLRSEKLGSVISTRNVVMKMDIEGGESDFVRTSGSLFDRFNFVAVQQEYMPIHNRGSNKPQITVSFYSQRNYVPFRASDMKKLAADQANSWNMDVIWVRSDFVKLVTG